MRIKTYSLFLTLAINSAAQACGPWFPQAYVLRNDGLFYSPPEVGFEYEIEHLKPEVTASSARYQSEMAGGESAVEELRLALEQAGVPKAKYKAIIAEYQAFRSTLNGIKPYVDRQPYAPYWAEVDWEQRLEKMNALEDLSVPEVLPEEFRLYLQGALSYYKDDHDSAVKAWSELLELPVAQRYFRSVMATYMIGKVCADPAHGHFKQVRALAKEGYPDSLELAAASYGREARLLMDRGQYLKAIHLYFDQWSAGYRNASQSMRRVAREAWAHADPATLAAMVEDEKARGVLTAYLLSGYDHGVGDQHRKRLMEALPDAKTLTMAEAGRFALLEYQ